jgi:LacI family transcriptional regulator
VADALSDGGFAQDTVTVYNSLHPMGDAGFKLTSLALADPKVTAILYSSALMAVEGHAAVLKHSGNRNIAVATMDDELHFVDLAPLSGHYSAARSSLREAGNAIIAELIRQCNEGGPGRGVEVPSLLEAAPGLDASVLMRPIPAKRRPSRRLLPA